jgi:hypothetical protein
MSDDFTEADHECVGELAQRAICKHAAKPHGSAASSCLAVPIRLARADAVRRVRRGRRPSVPQRDLGRQHSYGPDPLAGPRASACVCLKVHSDCSWSDIKLAAGSYWHDDLRAGTDAA